MGKANRARVRAFEADERALGLRFLSNAQVREVERATGRTVVLDVGGDRDGRTMTVAPHLQSALDRLGIPYDPTEPRKIPPRDPDLPP
jgi:hypothetical protein